MRNIKFDAVLQQMSARNSTVLAELDAEAAALEQARAAADDHREFFNPRISACT